MSGIINFQIFGLEEAEAFSLAASHRQRKKYLLCGLSVFAVSKTFLSVLGGRC
jgi:hypothetical protein